ncbi:MAG TPA: TonB C-terminal domain-containing protein [Deltaproteobacteria bacterium]|nr:TonB C-terminal domain-containing protein [Deltaproteobacteria bacterium]
MQGLRVRTTPRETGEPGWSRVIVLSLLLHLVIFSAILFVPDSIPTRRISGAAVYEVNLVEMPARARPASRNSSQVKGNKGVISTKESPTARRLKPVSRPAPKEEKVVIGKRVVKRKKEKKREVKKRTKRPRVSPSRLIDRAVSKIEKKVKARKKDHLGQAISRIEARAREEAGEEPAGGGPQNGITIRIYQLAVEEQIKSNWSYPVALVSPKKRSGLIAIVVVKVRNDGTIMKSWFKERSSDSVFDGSVLKAIERSDPLPPFPQGYRKSYDEIEIRFDLSEFEDA